MGYKILYKPDDMADPFFRKQTLTATVFLLTCYLIRYFWPDGWQMLQQYLLSGADVFSIDSNQLSNVSGWLEQIYGS